MLEDFLQIILMRIRQQIQLPDLQTTYNRCVIMFREYIV